jgi:hypothetical protein
MKSASWATRATKSGKQLLKLPMRLGVPCGGQAGLSRRRGDRFQDFIVGAGLPGLVLASGACSASGDGGRKPVQNAKSFGWTIYAAGFAIWLLAT